MKYCQAEYKDQKLSATLEDLDKEQLVKVNNLYFVLIVTVLFQVTKRAELYLEVENVQLKEEAKPMKVKNLSNPIFDTRISVLLLRL